MAAAAELNKNRPQIKAVLTPSCNSAMEPGMKRLSPDCGLRPLGGTHANTQILRRYVLDLSPCI
jgi:hypothetical protein